VAALLAAAGVSFAAPEPAVASPDSLRLAIEDITFGAADVAASPVTGGFATAGNLQEVSDNVVLQALYVVPGWLGATFVQASQGALRMLVGALELVPGIVLFPFPNTDVPEDFNVFRRGEMLVDVRNPLGENPPWLAYVPPATPFTIDARIAPISPWVSYRVSEEDAPAGAMSATSGPAADASLADAR
jgi:hypothetical protein